MKKNSRKIAGVIILLAGIAELVIGISKVTFSTILIGICFCIIGCLYFFEKKNIS
ncbi:MAG: hypothetical protein J6A58_11195 [Oscillospiraceae bacterium]|nr:hypothetical protein [Oscillospiraceae bacterium]